MTYVKTTRVRSSLAGETEHQTLYFLQYFQALGNRSVPLYQCLMLAYLFIKTVTVLQYLSYTAKKNYLEYAGNASITTQHLF